MASRAEQTLWHTDVRLAVPSARGAHLLKVPLQDVRYDARVPGRLRRLRAAPEQLETLQFDHSSNGSNGGAPPEDPTLSGCSTATLSVHGGERAGRPRVYDSLTTPIVQVIHCCSCWAATLAGRRANR